MRRLSLILAALVAAPRWAECHQLDEYLQATRIAVAAGRVAIEIDLTPGVAVASRVFAAIDEDRDGVVSRQEIDKYVHRVLQDVAVSVDGRDVGLSVTRVDCPSWEEMRGGAGTIRVEAEARIESIAAGRHRLRVVNMHEPEISAYLVNALVQSDPGMTISGQHRDVLQHRIDLDLDVARPSTAILWTVVVGGLFGPLFRVRRSTR